MGKGKAQAQGKGDWTVSGKGEELCAGPAEPGRLLVRQLGHLLHLRGLVRVRQILKHPVRRLF